MDIAFITDSGTGRSIQYFEEKGIISLPLQIFDHHETFNDYVNIDTMQCINMLHEERVLKTSLPNLGLIEEMFESLKANGITNLVAVPICKGLSSSYDTLVKTAERYEMKMVCINTYVTSSVQEYIVTRYKELIEKNVAIEEIETIINNIIDSCNTLLLPTNLKHLVRGGRLTPLAATLAGLLKIVPVLNINKKTNGKIDVYDKVRTFNKAITKILTLMNNEIKDEKYHIVISHVDNGFEATKIAQQVKELFHNCTVEVQPLCNVVAVHTGIGCISLQYFKKL